MNRANRAKKRKPRAAKLTPKQKFAQLREVSVIHGDPRSSDEQYGPFMVGEAATMLDLLDRDAGADGLNWFERTEDLDFKTFVLMTATLRALLKHAIRLACTLQPRLQPQSPWVRRGILWLHEPTEMHLMCLFCDESIATLGRDQGRGKLPPAFIDKLDRHTQPCAMRYLLKWCTSCQIGAPQASTDRAAAEVSTTTEM